MTQKDKITHINYRSDLDFIVKLTDRDGNILPMIGDIHVRIWTESEARACVSSRVDGACVNCCEVDGGLRLFHEAHGLAPGQLRLRLSAYVPSELFETGRRRCDVSLELPLELVAEGGTYMPLPDGAVMEMLAPYALLDAYDMAVHVGYQGTREEYMTSVGMLPDLAATISDLRQGKREIAQALTDQGIPTAADAPMAEMAQSVRTLYQIPDTAVGAREHVTARGAYSRYDMVAEVNRHRRADYPHCIGFSFTGDTVKLGAADACVLSDGTWIAESGAEHTFTDGEAAHYAVCYFREDFFAMPWPDGVEVLDIACLGSHPTFSASTARPFVNLFIDSAPASYDGHDFSVGAYGASVVIGGVSELPSGSAIVSGGNVQVLEMPDLESCRRAIASNCATLRQLTLLELKRASGAIASNLPLLSELSLPSLESATGVIAAACPALKRLSLPVLVEAPAADVFGLLENLVYLSLPKLKALWISSISFKLPKIESLTLPSVETIFFGNGFFTMNMPNLRELRLPSAVTISGNGGLLRNATNIDVYLPKVVTFSTGLNWPNKDVRLHFGAQIGVSFYLNSTAVTAITIEPGFTGSIDFKSSVLSVDNLRNLIANLGDNTGSTTLRLQMGADNLAQLTEDEIAVATAKNYTLS